LFLRFNPTAKTSRGTRGALSHLRGQYEAGDLTVHQVRSAEYFKVRLRRYPKRSQQSLWFFATTVDFLWRTSILVVKNNLCVSGGLNTPRLLDECWQMQRDDCRMEQLSGNRSVQRLSADARCYTAEV